jgi:heme-degrading monooxygenase HmoA
MIFWEYQVEDHRRSEFEEAYGAGGDWARLFRNASGYLGSRLLHDVGDARAYLTIDAWADRDAFEAFMAHWGG